MVEVESVMQESDLRRPGPVTQLRFLCIEVEGKVCTLPQAVYAQISEFFKDHALSLALPTLRHHP